MTGRRFHELRNLINEYVQSVGEEARNAFFYVTNKFYCLDRVLDEVAELREALRGKSVTDDGEAVEILRSLIWTEFLAETFVYHANAAQRELSKLPGLGKFDPEGVRDARNKLMEHWGQHRAPRKKLQKEPKRTKTGFGVFSESWPIIRPQRFPGDPIEPMDKGIFANADGFITDLETKLSNEIKRRKP